MAFFCGNGLMFADRTLETPKIKGNRICYQNIAFEDIDWENRGSDCTQ